MSVTVQAIPQEPPAASINNVNEFYVPNILSFNLKKTPEDRLQTSETDNTSSHENGDIVLEENKNLEMSSIKKSLRSKQQTSSFLLEPFLKPVANQLESNKENPVLKALFGGKTPENISPWTYTAKSSVNCHPFKKTEFSHDLQSDDIPVQVPQGLTKRPSKAETARAVTAVLKERQLRTTSVENLSGLRISRSSVSDIPAASINKEPLEKKRSIAKESFEKKKELDLSISRQKKKVISQTNIPPTARARNQYVNCERLIKLRMIVDNAIKNHKVYSMTGCYNSVRNALKQRGWIEKIDNDVKGRRKVNRYEEIGIYDAAFQFVQKYQTVAAMRSSINANSGFTHCDQINYTGQGEAEIINKMLKNVTEDLCWLSRPYPYYCWKDFDKFEMVNRLPRAYFSNKVGLCNSLQQIQWFYETGVCSTQYPRTYNVSTKDEVEAFKEDFKLTACIGTLKWFLHSYRTEGENGVRSPDGKIDTNVIEFALRRCTEFVKTKQHEDIDVLNTPTIWEYQWDQFMTQYYKIINYGQKLKDTKDGIATKAIYLNVQSMLNILKPYWPQYDIEGYQNFWIVKPGGRCCGAGIVIKNNLEQILLTINPTSMRETRFVVQKYIERPLLIYNTKFDIRQWFLVTNVYPLTIWMYKECYLRFCSQPFTLRNTHESIHLCNNAIQRKYKNGKRDRGLPDENMWDCYTFQTYLKTIGHPEAWEKYIYPGMREGFVGALLASQDSMERKKNCFELYGADFMISETLTDGPWLIEINSNPAMDSSTSVTARLCPQVLEDIIKVVIDRRNNKSAPTGAFEMVYKQNCPPIPPYLGMTLCVKGKKAYKSSGDNKLLIRKSKTKKSCESLPYTDTEEESIVEEIISVSHCSKNPEDLVTEVNSDATDQAHSDTDVSSQIKKEEGCKRRKVDWVKKNIEDLKAIQFFNRTKIPFDTISEKSDTENSSEEDISREKILKLFEALEINAFIRELRKVQGQKKESDEKTPTNIKGLITERFEKVKAKDDILTEEGVLEKIKEKLSNIFQLYYLQRAEGKDIHLETLIKEVSEKLGIVSSKPLIKTYSNFDTAFQKELETAEEKEKGKSGEKRPEDSFKSDRSPELFTKTSLEYFRDWKSKLNETQKTCEDILIRLNSYKECHSNIKFQEAVDKRIKDETDFVKRIKQRKKTKEGRKTKKEEKDYMEGKDKLKLEECATTAKMWDTEGGLTPLAINSENGAVRNISNSLPKSRQRSRSLLPNGSSGHGRKIDVTSEETCCH